MSHTTTLAGPPGLAENEIDGIREFVRGRLEEAAGDLRAEGLPIPALDGKVLRPLSAFLSVPPAHRGHLDERFWKGSLAVEMVHEASLLHDDILDEAPERRGRPTLSAAAGVGPALVLGDHLLTAAYRVAIQAQCPPFLEGFIRAVERTVAGEISQEKAQGRTLSEAEYRTIVTGKSGELFRAIFSLAPHLLETANPEAVGQIGARLGCLYQMVDDFLDYCPDADRGKAPLQDLKQRKWTWPLGLLPFPALETSEQEEVLKALFQRTSLGPEAPMERGVRILEEEAGRLLEDLSAVGMHGEGLATVLSRWIRLVRRSASAQAKAFSGPAIRNRPKAPLLDPSLDLDGVLNDIQERAEELGTPKARLAYFGHHGKTFRFASRLFPGDALQAVAGIYAFCRFTDDLVDQADDLPASVISTRLDLWGQLTEQAYDGNPTGIALLDQVMAEMRKASVPFRYARELLEGVRMDLNPRDFSSLEELREYSYRVASVVGGWLTELSGVHDPLVLDRAFSLGHGMQLTNILRDVGEDLAVGRIYLPRDRMRYHGVDAELLEAMARHQAPIFPGYRNLLEELMEEAEREYDRAFHGIPHLPLHFRAPVAVAAQAYRGIHREIRRNQYDNLSRRARTGLVQKVGLGGLALLRLLWPGRHGLALQRSSHGNSEGERTTTGPLRETGGEAPA